MSAWTCPDCRRDEHHCSPLLNGCSIPVHHVERTALRAAIEGRGDESGGELV